MMDLDCVDLQWLMDFKINLLTDFIGINPVFRTSRSVSCETLFISWINSNDSQTDLTPFGSTTPALLTPSSHNW
ncbi:hypothetical protein WICPIJ_009950 [Wickerhamomyces pijperi]|uniref:Uncharacterized protein n=1 Tax=Wickerhamomyces pijperi TaxID=599730 RepID=A0A9P8TB14_WICPI|nr:hypothetical protein WICPIJ_009950 [Wickerhamomyces pijperi]